MSAGKRDRQTEQMTTGHERNGIEELNMPRSAARLHLS